MKRFILVLCIFLSLSLVVSCSKKENDKDTFSDTNENIQSDLNETKDNSDNKTDDEKIESENEEKELDYVLYLRKENEPYLISQKYTIKSNDKNLESKSLEEVALNHLIEFSGFEGYITPIPNGTKLNSFDTNDKKIILDLSKDFIENIESDKLITELTISSIVNTLTVLNNYNTVEFTFEGEIIDSLNGVDMNGEFQFFNNFFYDK